MAREHMGRTRLWTRDTLATTKLLALALILISSVIFAVGVSSQPRVAPSPFEISLLSRTFVPNPGSACLSHRAAYGAPSSLDSTYPTETRSLTVSSPRSGYCRFARWHRPSASRTIDIKRHRAGERFYLLFTTPEGTPYEYELKTGFRLSTLEGAN